MIKYPGSLSIVRHFELWSNLMRGGPLEVHVLGGNRLLENADALAIAAYLPADRLVYHSASGARDVSDMLQRLKVDTKRRTPVIRRLGPMESERVLSEITRHYVKLVADNGYQVPQGRNPQSAVRERFSRVIGLAQDLMMRCPEISENPWWPVCLTNADEVVETVDRTLAYARVLEQLSGVSSALEIGCGSGFVTLFLAAGGHYEKLMGTDASPERIDGANLLAKLSGTRAEFRAMGAERIEIPDKTFDVVFSCYVLEQCADVLDRVIDECLRVARKFVVFFEPSAEAWPTIPGLVHIPMHGYPTDYVERFMRRGLAFSLIKPPLRNIYNPGVIHVVNVNGSISPHVLCPALLDKVTMTDA